MDVTRLATNSTLWSNLYSLIWQSLKIYTGGNHIRKKGFQKNEFLSVYICLRVGTWFGPKFGIGRSWSSWSSRSSIHTTSTRPHSIPSQCGAQIYTERNSFFLKSFLSDVWAPSIITAAGYLATSMLVTDVGDEISWWQLLYVGANQMLMPTSQ